MTRRRRGIALIMALFILLFVFLLGMTFRYYTEQNYLFAVETTRKSQLYYVAESGIEYCMAQRAYWNNGVPPGTEIKIHFTSGWAVIKDYADSGSGVTLTAVGMLRDPAEGYVTGPTVSIKALLDSSGNILRWEVE
jgi:hypothetical protein